MGTMGSSLRLDLGNQNSRSLTARASPGADRGGSVQLVELVFPEGRADLEVAGALRTEESEENWEEYE